MPQQYESCYPVWEKFSEVTRSIRFAKELMQETLNKECIEKIQKFYKRNRRKQGIVKETLIKDFIEEMQKFYKEVVASRVS